MQKRLIEGAQVEDAEVILELQKLGYQEYRRQKFKENLVLVYLEKDR
ncbi:MAG: hypothetical protein PVI13_06560 [Desulfobacterales bacterium]|jgi:hypothetical protein